jgi:four helix bundle protein
VSKRSLGSASEVEYQLLLGHDLGLLGEQTHRTLATRCTEVSRMLTALIQKLMAES